jgi:hypothetical protein
MRHREFDFETAFASFVLPIGVRLIPEMFAFPYPLGFDTVAYYIPISLSKVALTTGITNYLGGTILLYLLFTYAYILIGNAVVAMKLIPALLLGLFGWSTYQMGRRFLRWSSEWALVLALTASLYFVTLRISWDLNRNIVGLTLVILTLAFLSDERRIWRFIGAPAFASLALMFHEASAVLIGLLLVVHFVTDRNYRNRLEWLRFLPVWILYGFQFALSRGLGAQIQSTATLPEYSASFLYNVGFFLFAFIFLLPLAVVGLKMRLKRHIALWCIAALLFGLLPNFGLNTGSAYRWIFLLVVPVPILFVQGIKVLTSLPRGWRSGIGKTVIALSLVALIVVSSGYVGTHGLLRKYFDLAPSYQTLMPVSMVESTIAISDMPDFSAIVIWSNASLSKTAIVVLPFQLYGLYLTTVSQIDPTKTRPLDQTMNLDDIMKSIQPLTGPNIVYARNVDLYFPGDEPKLVNLARESALNAGMSVYVVWWNPGQPNNSFNSLPSNFQPVFVSGRFAVYSMSSTLS